VTATLDRADYSAPDATLLLRADTSRDEWLAARRTGIGGSDAAAVMGENPYRSAYEVWLDKTGRAEPDAMNDAMQRGNWLEPHLAAWFTEQTGIALRRAGLRRSKLHPWQLGSVDRDTADGGILEVKTSGGHTANAKVWQAGGVPTDAWWQGQHYLSVTGRSHVWYVAYVDPSPILAGPIDRDADAIAELVGWEEGLWCHHIERDTPPPVDPERITAAEIALRWPTEVSGTSVEAPWPQQVRHMLAERADCKDVAKRNTDRAAEIDQALKVLTGEAETLLCDGRPVLTLKARATAPHVDKRLEQAHPEIWREFVSTPNSRALHILKEKTS
jgi:putative phage-type endonuclease